MTEMKLHPACAAFPAMPDKELAALAVDIRERGLLEPITIMPDGAILDGRNRWLACEQVGIEPMVTVYHGDDPIRFVISKNERRRHLPHAQRALIAAELANLAHGSNQYRQKMDPFAKGPTPLSQSETARLLDVSETSVSDAAVVYRGAADNVIAMVKDGEVGLQSAAIAVRVGNTKSQQAKLTAVEIKAIAADYKNKPSKVAKPKEPQLIAYRGSYKSLSPEESGRPPPELAGEQAPGYPEGVNRMQAHIREHGHVQLWSPKETKQLQLGEKFLQFRMLLKRVATLDYPGPDEIDGQKPEPAKETREYLAKYLEKAIERLVAFRDAPIR